MLSFCFVKSFQLLKNKHLQITLDDLKTSITNRRSFFLGVEDKRDKNDPSMFLILDLLVLSSLMWFTVCNIRCVFYCTLSVHPLIETSHFSSITLAFVLTLSSDWMDYANNRPEMCARVAKWRILPLFNIISVNSWLTFIYAQKNDLKLYPCLIWAHTIIALYLLQKNKNSSC